MGGFGSGYYSSNPSKTAVEHCKSIDIRRWQREELLNRSSFSWSWRNGEGQETGSIGVLPEEDQLILSYKANDEPVKIVVPYDETKTGFGVRKWFVCTSCGGRCAVLYLKGKYFACRKCHDLNYRSSQLSGDPVYYHGQLEKLCRTLKAEYDPTRPIAPWKPKNMHWKTYNKLSERYRYLADQRDRLFLAGAKRILNRCS